MLTIAAIASLALVSWYLVCQRIQRARIIRRRLGLAPANDNPRHWLEDTNANARR